MQKNTYREIEVCLCRHDETFGFDAAQSLRKVTSILDLGDIPLAPGVNQSDQVICVPTQQALLPIPFDE